METENYRDRIIRALRRFDEGSIGDVFDTISTEELYVRLNDLTENFTAEDLIRAVDEGF